MPAPTFELYKLLVEEVREARKARRDLANVFTTLNVAAVGVLSSMVRPSEAVTAIEEAVVGVRATADAMPLFFIVAALLLICLVWRTSNAYYSRLLGAKYRILYEVEADLGIDPIRREWHALGDRSLFKFFSFERMMPLAFAIGYLVFLAYQIPTPGLLAPFKATVLEVIATLWR